MLERIEQEPALSLGVVQALIAVAVSFGLEVTPQQVGLIVAATATVLSWITRSNVTPAPKDDL